MLKAGENIMNIAYFDNAATTYPKPECVYVAMDDFARNCGVSLGRGQHKLSSKASYIANETRELLLRLFHCDNKKVVFTNTATEALNTILFGMSYKETSVIYISPFEHNSVTRTLHEIKKHHNIVIRQLSVSNESFEYNISEIKKQFSEFPPDIVIVSHASNVIGLVAPIKDIFTEAKKYSATTIADMCQTAGLIDIDISSNIFDYVVFAGHKTLYGPLGISGFASSCSDKLHPLIYGGTGIESANQNMPEEVPIKFEAGSHNSISIAGLNASLKWILKTGINKIYDQEQLNKEKLLCILKKYNNIKVYNFSNQIGVLSCVFDGYSSDEIGQVLSENNIAFRSGLQCAPMAHKFINTFPAGTIRFSVGYFNTQNDFDQLDEVLKYIYENS